MKNTFTFPHDYGARNDTELQRLLFEYGPEAGWAYWVIIEMLYEQGGKIPKTSYNQIAYAAHVPAELIQNIIEGSSLFKTDKKSFWSDRVEFTLETREEKASKSRTAAQAKWAKWRKNRELEENASTESMQTPSERSADAQRTLCHNSNNNSNNTNNSNSDNNILSLEIETISVVTPEELKDLWNARRGKLPKVATLTDERKRKAKARIAEFGKNREEQLATIASIMEHIAASEFLQVGWGKCSFDWLITNSGNWLKVIEGNYDNKKDAKQSINEKWERN